MSSGIHRAVSTAHEGSRFKKERHLDARLADKMDTLKASEFDSNHSR